MSYILEALKKADQERDVGTVPKITTPQEVKHSRDHSYRWLWVTVALLVVNVVLAVLLLKDRGAEAPVTVQAQPERRPAPAKHEPAPAIRQSDEVTIARAPTPAKTVLPETHRAPSGGQVVMLPGSGDVQNSEALSLPEEEPDQEMGAAKGARDDSQLQSWYELPQDFRNKLDLPRLDIHAYSEEPQNRFILVNLKKYREGDRLESGLVLEEILPDGMVMSYRGERFLVDK